MIPFIYFIAAYKKTLVAIFHNYFLKLMKNIIDKSFKSMFDYNMLKTQKSTLKKGHTVMLIFFKRY